MDQHHTSRHAYIATTGALGVLVAIMMGCLLMPHLFWDKVVWPYLWGPVVADAYAVPIDGITEGYNLVNTTIYGLILSISIYWIYVFIKKLGIEADWKFILALSPYILLGGTMRALEDARLFQTPVSYFFISPFIYLTIAGFAILGLASTWLFLKRLPTPMVEGDRGTLFLAGNLVVVGVLVTLFVGTLVTQESYSIGIIIAIGGLSYMVSRLPLLRDPEEGTGYLAVTAANGTFLLMMSGVYIIVWLYNPWITGVQTRPMELIIIPAIAAAVSAAVLISLWLASFKYTSLSMYTIPTSVIIIAGHMIDAAATYRGIADYGYLEKHPLPRTIMEVTGTPLSMFLFKLGIVLFVIYILEGQIKGEVKDKTVLGLLRLAVLVLGISPGIRDILRIAMGV